MEHKSYAHGCINHKVPSVMAAGTRRRTFSEAHLNYPFQHLTSQVHYRRKNGLVLGRRCSLNAPGASAGLPSTSDLATDPSCMISSDNALQSIESDILPQPSCPMHDSSSTPHSNPFASAPSLNKTRPEGAPSACPVAQTPSATGEGSSPSTIAALNPLNYMPSDLSQARESLAQTFALPTVRETSTIPRGAQSTGPHAGAKDDANWVYPSPQQMYNALIRKGFNDTPADAVEAMVAVHNFLNEGAWAEILEWERRFGKGLARGWNLSKFGEDGSLTGAMIEPDQLSAKQLAEQPRLLRFMGRSNDMTPKARFGQFLGWVAPGWYAGPAPFDRHDWFIERRNAQGQPQQVRYVIDYYSAGVEESGEPIFFLDIRPALDGPTAAAERLIRWGRDVWWRASGGQVRQVAEVP